MTDEVKVQNIVSKYVRAADCRDGDAMKALL